jgi:hypothetical protein
MYSIEWVYACGILYNTRYGEVPILLLLYSFIVTVNRYDYIYLMHILTSVQQNN